TGSASAQRPKRTSRAAPTEQPATNPRTLPPSSLEAAVLSRFFIDRPVFATVLSVVITLVGGIALISLPVAQYPRITPAGVAVTISYPGANAQVVAETVAAPVEQQATAQVRVVVDEQQVGHDALPLGALGTARSPPPARSAFSSHRGWLAAQNHSDVLPFCGASGKIAGGWETAAAGGRAPTRGPAG